MKQYYKFIKIFVLALTAVILITGIFYNSLLSSVSKKDVPVSFEVVKGQTFSTIASSLKESDLIKSEIVFKVYVRLFAKESLKAGKYTLNKNMDVKQLVSILEKGNSFNSEVVRITFKEGKNMRHYADLIEQNTQNNQEDVFNKMNDNNYLNSLIEKYWFITDEIKNKNIYYSLEGYLFPDTYEFMYSDSVENIFNKMLENTSRKLEPLKKDLENSKYTVHEMLTLASIIELEAGNASDRKGVAQVFYNRLENNWSLGSDVTTYYAARLDNFKQDLFQSWIDESNYYNTRHQSMAGKLPVSPICNPGILSITAAFEPNDHDYFYFVADKFGVTYFTKTNFEHEQKTKELKENGLWIEYEN
jgi:UPF0755 protein